jgi:alanine dehydrogenase
MKFGIPVEIRNHENRVGATPDLVKEIVELGHSAYVECDAGSKSLYSDEQYQQAGAIIVPSPEKLYGQSDIILKIRAPKPIEYELIEHRHTILAFFQFFNYTDMVKSLIGRGANCFGYELYREGAFTRPVLDEDRKIAGQMAVQLGGFYLQKSFGGRGVLIGSLPDSRFAANVVVLGSGSAGVAAANIAAKMGANVTLLEVDSEMLQVVKNALEPSITTGLLDEETLSQIFPLTDLLICAFQRIEMEKPPKLTEDQINLMPKGSVVIDLDIEFDGGALAYSRPMKMDDPVFIQNDILHFCVPNLAGGVPWAGSNVHSMAIRPLIKKIAQLGFDEAVKTDPYLASGLVIYEGQIANKLLADNLSMPYFDVRR